MKKKEHKFWRNVGRVLPYLAAMILVFGVAKIGSEDKVGAGDTSLNMNDIAASGGASADQLSELYVVASISNAMDLASVDYVSGNYVAASVLKDIAQTATDKIEKPGYVAVSDARGAVNYTVVEGDTMESIAAKYGITTDHIRWSNGLKTTDVSPGQTLVLPTKPGIVYVIKDGDTAETIAAHYGSNAQEIISLNDLESGLTPGKQIIVPGGVVPETERPEYVRRRGSSSSSSSTSSNSYGYTYYGSSMTRQNLRRVYDNVVRDPTNKMYGGQCTYYAWWWRWAHGNPLPGDGQSWGNARSWASAARRYGLLVDKNPSVGAVFQTASGGVGHVGVVIGVNSDGSILVREMNYNYHAGVIFESTIPASYVRNFNYIH